MIPDEATHLASFPRTQPRVCGAFLSAGHLRAERTVVVARIGIAHRRWGESRRCLTKAKAVGISTQSRGLNESESGLLARARKENETRLKGR